MDWRIRRKDTIQTVMVLGRRNNRLEIIITVMNSPMKLRD